MKQQLSGQGYLRVNLRKEGESKHHPVHKLVYEAFNGKRRDGLVIDHVDGDRLNNNLSNLRELTTRENTARAKVSRYGRGVRLFKGLGKFGAEIQIEGERYYLGVFPTAEEASQAYKEALANYEMNGTVPFKRDRSVKRCDRCGQDKPLDEFYYCKSHGHSYLCKECHKEYMRELRRRRVKGITSRGR